MRVLVIGAAGNAGKAAVSSLLRTGGIKRIFLADHNAEALSKMAADLYHLPVSPRFLDAENARGLRERMAEADLVLGCLGPFHRHEGRMVEAAISERRDYISLCDDSEASAQAFSLSSDAEKRGVRILCGCGVTPGISNILACRAASRLDRVKTLELSWYLQMGGALGAASLEHLLRVLHGKSATYEGGRVREARAGSWEEEVEFPPPVGWQPVSFLGHPEPITLPDTIREVLDIRFKAGVGGRGKNLVLQSLAWMGEGERSELWLAAQQAVASGIARRGGGPCRSSLRITAAGESGGIEERVTRAVVGDYYRLSGAVMASAVEQWMQGGWPQGIFPPERVLDNRLFFGKLHARGLRFMVGEKGAEGDNRDDGRLTA